MTSTHSSKPTKPRRQIHGLTQADFSELVCVAKSSISRAANGILAPAMLPDGSLDSNHPLAVRYFASHCKPSAFVVFQDTFAEMAGCDVAQVKTALERGGSLVPAMTLGSFQIRVTHPASLAFLAAHPFEIDDKYFPVNVPASLDASEKECRNWPFEHPLSQAYDAREEGAIAIRKSKASQ